MKCSTGCGNDAVNGTDKCLQCSDPAPPDRQGSDDRGIGLHGLGRRV